MSSEAASAGAGLAVAFNAPIGGSIFVFEELTGSITPWLLVSTLAAATVAVWLMRVMLGNTFSFVVQQVSPTENWNKWPFLALGAVMGVCGAVYNQVVLGMLRASDKMMRLSSLQRATIIGAVVGLVGWFVPSMIGGGDSITQAILSNQFALRTLVTIFAVRFLLGPWSYAAGCPGGLFAPLMLLGAASGAMFAGVVNYVLPDGPSFAGGLRRGGHGSAVYRQRARAANRHRPEHRDDRPRRPDARPAGRVVDGYVRSPCCCEASPSTTA